MHPLAPHLPWPSLLQHAAGQTLAHMSRPLQRLLHSPAATRSPRLALTMPLPPRDVQARGEELYHGLWHLAGEKVATDGRIVFDLTHAPRHWQQQLHRFDWIFALLQPKHRLWVMMARRLVLDWLARHRRNALPLLALAPAQAAGHHHP